MPDDLFHKADELAAHLGLSRSQVYREALEEYLARRDPNAVTEALDHVVMEMGDDSEEWSGEAARRALGRTEW